VTAQVVPVDTGVVPPVDDPTGVVELPYEATAGLPLVDDATLVATGMVSPDPDPGLVMDGGEDGGGDPAAKADERQRIRQARLERGVRLVALVFTYTCLVILLFLGYLFGFTGLQHSRDQRIIISNLSGPEGAAARAGKTPANGLPVATLRIPALHLEEVVVEGTSAQDLENGPGFMAGSAPIGVRGNSVIAARRVTFGGPFQHLMSLVPGDLIQVSSGKGLFRYRVVKVGTALPGMKDPVSPSARSELTLITSPPLVDPGREYATARMTSAPANHPEYHITPPNGNLALAGDPSALLPAVVWGIVLFGVCVGTVLAYRRWTQTWTIYLLTTPVLIAVAILCFQNVALLLPATF
jgi:sortase A